MTADSNLDALANSSPFIFTGSIEKGGIPTALVSRYFGEAQVGFMLTRHGKAKRNPR